MRERETTSQPPLALVWSLFHDDGRDRTGATPPRAAWAQVEDPTAIREEPPPQPEVAAPARPTVDERSTVIHVNFRTKQWWRDDDV